MTLFRFELAELPNECGQTRQTVVLDTYGCEEDPLAVTGRDLSVMRPRETFMTTCLKWIPVVNNVIVMF